MEYNSSVHVQLGRNMSLRRPPLNAGYGEEIWVRKGGRDTLSFSTMVHKSTLEIWRHWKVAYLPKWKKAWEWGHKCRRSGALSFSVRGKQWEGGLQGPTKGPPYEKKKGEIRRQGPLPFHTLLQVSFKHEQEKEVWNMKAVGNGLH